MSTTYVSADLRRLVASRAGYACEYCLVEEEDTFFGAEVDHIISEKHGGETCESNLAYACLICNRSKGSDIASLIPGTLELVRLYNPRTDRWSAHFRLHGDGVTIVPLTAIGEATERILGLNQEERLLERQALKEVGRYPSTFVRSRLEL